jgi:hypothetical protein
MQVGINIVQLMIEENFINFNDEDEEELISNDSNTVDLSKFKPHFPLKKSN